MLVLHVFFGGVVCVSLFFWIVFPDVVIQRGVGSGKLVGSGRGRSPPRTTSVRYVPAEIMVFQARINEDMTYLAGINLVEEDVQMPQGAADNPQAATGGAKKDRAIVKPVVANANIDHLVDPTLWASTKQVHGLDSPLQLWQILRDPMHSVDILRAKAVVGIYARYLLTTGLMLVVIILHDCWFSQAMEFGAALHSHRYEMIPFAVGILGFCLCAYFLRASQLRRFFVGAAALLFVIVTMPQWIIGKNMIVGSGVLTLADHRWMLASFVPMMIMQKVMLHSPYVVQYKWAGRAVFHRPDDLPGRPADQRGDHVSQQGPGPRLRPQFAELVWSLPCWNHAPDRHPLGLPRHRGAEEGAARLDDPGFRGLPAVGAGAAARVLRGGRAAV